MMEGVMNSLFGFVEGERLSVNFSGCYSVANHVKARHVLGNRMVVP